MHKCLYHQRFKSTSFCYCMTLHTLRNMPDTVRRGPHYLKAPKSIFKKNLNNSQSHLANNLHHQIKWQRLQIVLSKIKEDIVFVTSWTSGPAFYHISNLNPHAGQSVTAPLRDGRNKWLRQLHLVKINQRKRSDTLMARIYADLWSNLSFISPPNPLNLLIVFYYSFHPSNQIWIVHMHILSSIINMSGMYMEAKIDRWIDYTGEKALVLTQTNGNWFNVAAKWMASLLKVRCCEIDLIMIASIWEPFLWGIERSISNLLSSHFRTQQEYLWVEHLAGKDRESGCSYRLQ